MCTEELCGGILHLLLLGGGNLVERGAMCGGFAVFDFGEIDFVVFSRDKVDFVSLGLEIVRKDSMPKGFEMVGDEIFGKLAFLVRRGWFWGVCEQSAV